MLPPIANRWREEADMEVLAVILCVVAGGYLAVAIAKPEWFS